MSINNSLGHIGKPRLHIITFSPFIEPKKQPNPESQNLTLKTLSVHHSTLPNMSNIFSQTKPERKVKRNPKTTTEIHETKPPSHKFQANVTFSPNSTKRCILTSLTSLQYQNLHLSSPKKSPPHQELTFLLTERTTIQFYQNPSNKSNCLKKIHPPAIK